MCWMGIRSREVVAGLGDCLAHLYQLLTVVGVVVVVDVADVLLVVRRGMVVRWEACGADGLAGVVVAFAWRLLLLLLFVVVDLVCVVVGGVHDG